MPTETPLFSREGRRIPAFVALEDLRSATIPSEYFHKLLAGRSIRGRQVDSLLPPEVSDKTQATLRQLVASDEEDDSGGVSLNSVVLRDEQEFVNSATEFVLCGLGSVTFLTPSSIALAQIRSVLRGSPSILSLAEETDYVFVADIVSAMQKKMFDAEPTAAAHVYEFLRAAKYAFRSKIVYGAWRGPDYGKAPTARELPEELLKIYPDSLVDLILQGAKIL